MPAELTSLIGRTGLLDDAAASLARERMVSLLGPAGIGKTRAAIRVAAAAASRFPGGVHMINLKPLSGPDEIVRAIGQPLKILDNNADEAPLRPRVLAELRDKTALLVLDNCESVIRELPTIVTDILEAAPGVRVLATSRVHLRIDGEVRLQVEPLTLEESLRLFADRAAAVNPSWARLRDGGDALPARDRVAMRTVCEAMDGNPLALELAAGRLDSISLYEAAASVADRADEGVPSAAAGVAAARRLRLLVDEDEDGDDPRHRRSLRAELERSYQGLSAAAQTAWRYLWIFEGSFDLDAAQRLGALLGIDPDTIPAIVRTLVRHSVMTAETRDETTRYSMFAALREFGATCLDEDGIATVEQVHARWVEQLITEANLTWFSERELSWMHRLRDYMPDIRLALDYLLSTPEGAIRGAILAFATVGTRVHIFFGQLTEARDILAAAWAALPAEQGPLHVAALSLNSYLALAQGDPDRGLPLLEQAEALAEALNLGEDRSLLFAKATRLWLATDDHRAAARAPELFARASALARQAGSATEAFMGDLFGAGAAAFVSDDADSVRQAVHRLVADAERSGARWSISWGNWVAAVEHMQYGDPVEAIRLVQQAIKAQVEMGETWSQTWGLWVRACLAIRIGDLATGALLHGGAVQRQQASQSHAGRLPSFRWIQDPLHERARHELGAATWDDLVKTGRSMDYAEIIELALLPAVLSPSQIPGGSDLSKRQAEVATLVAIGKANLEIADELKITVRTVEKHLEEVYKRLGVASRGELAAALRGTTRP